MLSHDEQEVRRTWFRRHWEEVAFNRLDHGVQQRVAELVERSKNDGISSEEQSELEDFLQLEHIMIMARARARQHTQFGK